MAASHLRKMVYFIISKVDGSNVVYVLFCSGMLNRARLNVWHIECHDCDHGRWKSHYVYFLDGNTELGGECGKHYTTLCQGCYVVQLYDICLMPSLSTSRVPPNGYQLYTYH